jgi:hypothetical protein
LPQGWRPVPRSARARGTAPIVVLDNEAVQVLRSPTHPKHRRTLAVVEATLTRSRATGAAPLVPTTVRVEARWDRRDPGAASVNRLRARDQALDTSMANEASALRAALDVSVADAHLGAVMQALGEPHIVFTSDVADVRRLAEHLRTPTTVVRL